MLAAEPAPAPNAMPVSLAVTEKREHKWTGEIAQGVGDSVRLRDGLLGIWPACSPRTGDRLRHAKARRVPVLTSPHRRDHERNNDAR